MKYSRILKAIENEVWAMVQSKLDTIIEFMVLKSRGIEIEFEAVPPREPEFIKALTHNHPGSDNCPVCTTMMVANSTNSGPPTGIAVIPIAGVISNKVNLMTQISGGTSLQIFKRQFRAAMDDPDIATIILDLDSPGGGVQGVQEMADEIYQANESKRIISSVTGMAGSAGYWLGSQAREFFMMKSSEVGSIGVFAVHENYSKALEKEGIETTYISAGQFKTEGAPEFPLGDDAKSFIQSRVDSYYDDFLKAVARGRGRSVSDIRDNFGSGRMYGSEMALKVGMVDGVKTIDEIISDLKRGNAPRRARAEIEEPKKEAGNGSLSDEDLARRQQWL